MAVGVIELKCSLTRHDSVLREQAESAIGAIEQFLIDPWSEAETSVDVAVLVLQNKILGLDGARAEDVWFDAVGPRCGRDTFRVPCAQEQKGNNEQQSDCAYRFPAAICGFEFFHASSQGLNID
jgi:hypothetical protein